MTFIATSRRRFLQTSLAAAGALSTGLGAGSSRQDEPGVDAGPFATENPTIRQARRVAIEILKPSAADLAHGLELHAGSLVFESYGFAPRAALDGAAFARAIEEGASNEELVDLREEMSMTRCATDENERREFLDAFHASGVTGIFQNTGEEGNDPLRLLKRLARFTYTTDLLRDHLAKAVRPDDVVAAKKAGTLCLAFTTNGVPLTQRWVSERDELRVVRLFHQLGVRMMHLTYNRRNPLGDGAGEPNDGGLSDFGRQAIAEMNRLGVIVDVAHSGWRTSLEAAKASSRPMVASHTTCAGLYKHFRGKPDETVRAICDTGGLIGICCIPRFLGGPGDITSFLDHIDYAVKRFGAEHVAVGPDIAYTSRNDAAERAKLPSRKDGRTALALAGPRWEHLWPVDNYKETPRAIQSLAWTNWPLFTVGMVQRGHSDDTIRKILGENVLRVWRDNTPAKS
jgi:membrane dipeptidase